MPNKIKLRRSYTAGAVPLTSDLETNEVAINFADSKLYVRTPQNTIQAITLGGSGGSGEDALLRALFVPPAPTSLTATAGNAQVALSWTAPTVLSVTPITDYVVQFSSNSGSTWTTFSDGTSTATSATVTGLTNGTAYVFRVAAVNGVGTGAYSTATSSVTPIAGDPEFANVSLLLHFEGESVVDNSSYSHTVTAAASNTSIPLAYRTGSLSTAQKRFGDKAWFANYQPGNENSGGSRLLVPSSSAFGFGTGDLCIEMWVRIDDYETGSTLFNAAGVLLNIHTSLGLGFEGTHFGGLASRPALNTWTHVALSRTSGQGQAYVNGARVLSFSWPANLGSGMPIVVGASGDDGYGTTSQPLRGYLDEVRVTKGSNRSYDGATITVPTAAFPNA
jgi:hypothetical protein